MAAAIALAGRGRGQTAPNPNVGCLVVAGPNDGGHIVGRGWTQPGGRPHAEAMALAEAGDAARDATAYVTLEPCAHHSERGPRCAELLVAAGIRRVVLGIEDPDPRTSGIGAAMLEDAGITVDVGVMASEAQRSMAGFLTRQREGRPHVTLKLATSLDGCIAMADGASRWITGPEARAHAHLERSRHEAILVGAGTVAEDAPTLDVRLPGLEARSPLRVMLGRGDAPAGWTAIRTLDAICRLEGVDHLLVEGGAQTAAAFLKAGYVERLLLYRAPIVIGAGRAALGDIGLDRLDHAHGHWRLGDTRQFGADRLEVYERVA